MPVHIGHILWKTHALLYNITVMHIISAVAMGNHSLNLLYTATIYYTRLPCTTFLNIKKLCTVPTGCVCASCDSHNKRQRFPIQQWSIRLCNKHATCFCGFGRLLKTAYVNFRLQRPNWYSAFHWHSNETPSCAKCLHHKTTTLLKIWRNYIA
jgi:hypothetical protein